MNARELLARLTDDLPPAACVIPAAFLDDEALPPALAPVEPWAFALACAQSLWGRGGPRN